MGKPDARIKRFALTASRGQKAEDRRQKRASQMCLFYQSSVLSPQSSERKRHNKAKAECLMRASYTAEYIGAYRRTRGTETSKYPEEKKSTEIPPVAASDRGLAERLALVEQSGKSGDTG